MYSIGIEYQFESAHFLEGLHETHKCARLHGHNYVLIVELQSETLDEVGFIVDYFDLKPIKNYIDGHIDHRLLNDVFDFNPTVENMVKFFYEKFKSWFPEISKITLKETPTTYASYWE
jgi:6-pyruvoyltetrahydropterin/6-carboxytetrahydropterin synthase